MKVCALILAGMMILPCLGGCAGKDGNGDNLMILCTVFAEYDWMRQVVGDVPGVEVSLLIEGGTDLHSYQATAADILKISQSDLIVTLGSTSDEWVHEALKNADRKIEIIELSKIEGIRFCTVSEEALLGEHEHDLDQHGPFDEHIWLSLRNAGTACRFFAERLCAMDEEHSDTYRKNAETYVEKLNAMDAEFSAFAESIPVKRILVADRFPFVYLAEDYGIGYSAAFEGCSAETETSFDTVIRLASRIEEWGLHYILISETSDGKLASSVKRTTKHGDQEILTMNSMQAVTASQISDGITYEEMMRENLSVLRQALS